MNDIDEDLIKTIIGIIIIIGIVLLLYYLSRDSNIAYVSKGVYW